VRPGARTSESEGLLKNRSDTGEEPIEVRRYIDALRHGLVLIGAITLVLGLAAFLVSTSLSKRYEARASIVEQSATVLDQTVDADTATRNLNTAGILLTTRRVLDAAAQQLPGETGDSLSHKVRSRVDPVASFIYVTATASHADQAAKIANAVAQTFIAQGGALERQEAQRERAGLQRELARLGNGNGGSAQAQALQRRISDLGVSIADAGSDLTIADPATPPTSAASPHPGRDGLLGLILGVFLGVIVVLGREQLLPRVGGGRELSRLLELPVLASIPPPRRGSRPSSGLDLEAYQALATSLRLSLPPSDAAHTLLVTSAVRGEGKSTVAAHLALALATSGDRTLVVSADLRQPMVHELLDVPIVPGLTDVLAGLRGPRADVLQLVEQSIRNVDEPDGLLDVLPSGRVPRDPAEALASAVVTRIFDAIRKLDYTYVLVDAPALLGVADRPIGAVIVGARDESSAYYIGERAPAYDDV
jgi:capsular polysaccharide biosynthesis protein